MSLLALLLIAAQPDLVYFQYIINDNIAGVPAATTIAKACAVHPGNAACSCAHPAGVNAHGRWRFPPTG